jgi:hypothetical protein
MLNLMMEPLPSHPRTWLELMDIKQRQAISVSVGDGILRITDRSELSLWSNSSDVL